MMRVCLVFHPVRRFPPPLQACNGPFTARFWSPLAFSAVSTRSAPPQRFWPDVHACQSRIDIILHHRRHQHDQDDSDPGDHDSERADLGLLPLSGAEQDEDEDSHLCDWCQYAKASNAVINKKLGAARCTCGSFSAPKLPQRERWAPSPIDNLRQSRVRARTS